MNWGGPDFSKWGYAKQEGDLDWMKWAKGDREAKFVFHRYNHG